MMPVSQGNMVGGMGQPPPGIVGPQGQMPSSQVKYTIDF